MTVFKQGDPVTLTKRPNLPAPRFLGSATVIWVGPVTKRPGKPAEEPSRYEVAMTDGSGTCFAFPDEMELRT